MVKQIQREAEIAGPLVVAHDHDGELAAVVPFDAGADRVQFRDGIAAQPAVRVADVVVAALTLRVGDGLDGILRGGVQDAKEAGQGGNEDDEFLVHSRSRMYPIGPPGATGTVTGCRRARGKAQPKRPVM